MEKTGIEDIDLIRDGKRLKCGYTTGTCAAAAAKAGARMLLSGAPVDRVSLMTPKGIALSLPVLCGEVGATCASCAVRKYSGDDPDVTDGILIFAQVWKTDAPGIQIDGGEGIGRITKPGLWQAVGQAAINRVPREMIRREVEEVLDEWEGSFGLKVIISAPEGVTLARKTFNPRLGIQGGISILGTSGIVEPMSESALVESIRLELRQKKALGCRRLLLTPGNYGADFAGTTWGVQDGELVKCSNFIGQTLDMAVAEGYGELLLVSHIGKGIKLAGGIMNTHSGVADGRGEVMAACALRAGCDGPTALGLLDAVTTEEMLAQLDQAGKREATMAVVGERVQYYLQNRVGEQVTVGAVLFSNELGILCVTGPAGRWLKEWRTRG